MAINDVKTVFQQSGDSIDYTPGSAVAAGDIVLYGSGTTGFVAVAKSPIAANALGAVAIRGVFQIPNSGSAGSYEVISAGAKVYLTSGGLVTATAGSNTPLGRCVATTTANDAVVKVAINVP